MALGEVHCSSCGNSLAGRGTTHFICPQCGENTIGRCARCRDQSVPYRCSRCDFQGP
ncbi:MAG TPA: zinc finger domain-containing protein [Thermoplasmata archaeon]|nr:zinc finger domain-containing protein [Thermoplasmata archaeon]